LTESAESFISECVANRIRCRSLQIGRPCRYWFECEK